MKQVIILSMFILFSIYANAQGPDSKVLQGQLKDSIRNQPVQNATVSLVKSSDSSLIAFTRSDDEGRFMFNNLLPGTFRLSASQVNFHSLWKSITISKADVRTDLGTIFMIDKSLLRDVTLFAARPPVVLNGDTLEFNAESFKTKPNAVVEDMLKKMPGIEIGKDGSIHLNGKLISRVLVNGKDFFNGDPKMATRNLPADAIDKVQVFDKQSDQSAFTGVDDGNSEKTINLKLKKDKNNAMFGKATISAGNKKHFDSQFNVNRFNGKRQLSAIGMANNTNRQGFSIMDMLNFTGQNRKMMSGGGGIIIHNGGPDDFGLPVEGLNNNQGLTHTVAGGVNYSDTWIKRSEVNASYLYNNITVNNSRNSSRVNLVPGNDFTSSQDKISSNVSTANRFNVTIDHKIDSFNAIKISSLAGYQKGSGNTASIYHSISNDEIPLNNGTSFIDNISSGYTINNNLMFRHKFQKRGRTFSFSGSMQYNNSTGKIFQNTINNIFWNGLINRVDTINQVTGIHSLTDGYGINANYTEPVSKRSLVELRTFYNKNSGSLDRKAYDYNKGTGKHDLVNRNGSNEFINQYEFAGVGVSFRTQQKKYNFSLGTNFQHGVLQNSIIDTSLSLKKAYDNILPHASFTYQFNRMKNIRIDYTSSISQPAAIQMQPVSDLTDPLNIKKGNPSLKQAFANILSMQFFNANPAQQKNVFGFINISRTDNAIVNSDQLIDGKRISTPVNANGVYNINANINRGFGVKKWHARFTYGGNAILSRSVNFINTMENKTTNLSFTPRLSANYGYKELIELDIRAGYTFNKATYSLSPLLNNNYNTVQYDVEVTLNLPSGFTINNEVAYMGYTGRADGFNSKVTIWNAFLSKHIFKSKKGEIIFRAFDILKQQNGIDRIANTNYIEDVHYKAPGQYFLGGFTYSLQKEIAGGPKAIIRTF